MCIACTTLWRPAPNMTRIEDAVGSAIAWPANKVELEKIRESQDVGNASSPSSVSTRSNKKCKLLDVDGSREIVAEGRCSMASRQSYYVLKLCIQVNGGSGASKNMKRAMRLKVSSRLCTSAGLQVLSLSMRVFASVDTLISEVFV
ncbi:hypothetical protein ACLB2K_013518 [Fragaria x ananassa]